MRIYNTLFAKKERLVKPQNRALNLFVCGPTVYDYSHIGHARTYLFFDIFVRYLRSLGWPVFYLQNITDVDDKIIARAKQEKKDPRELARFFEKEYYADMKALDAVSVNRYARAGDFIKEIQKQIGVLLEKGFAYQTKNGVYFEVKKFRNYGRLSKQDLNALRPGWRIEPDPEKKDPLDFALWKFFAGKPSWPSPWGQGRPGWHIEDTAISEKFFGPRYDLHGGAADLKFPHHESEISQQESASGKKPFVKIWMHTGFLLSGGEKMSKSLGNFVTIRDFLKKFPAETLRMIVLNHHYRSPVDYTDQLAIDAQNSIATIKEFIAKLNLIKAGPKEKTAVDLKKYQKNWQGALDDDFNTPQALAVIFRLINDWQKNIWELKKPEARLISEFIAKKMKIFGFPFQPEKIPAEVKKLAGEREKLRLSRDFEQADGLRKKISALGYKVEDTPLGPLVQEISNSK